MLRFQNPDLDSESRIKNTNLEPRYIVHWSWMVCWGLTSLCHTNGHVEAMPAREINPFTALTRIRSQFLRTQLSTSNRQRVDTTTPQTVQPSGLAHLPWNCLGNHLIHITSCQANSFPAMANLRKPMFQFQI